EIFTQIDLNAAADNTPKAQNEYRGDNVAPDIRRMLADDPSGTKRIDAIVQAKNTSDPVFRSILRSGECRIIRNLDGNTLLVNLPLPTVQALSLSGGLNYISPHRPTRITGHIEETLGASLIRAQSAT